MIATGPHAAMHEFFRLLDVCVSECKCVSECNLRSYCHFISQGVTPDCEDYARIHHGGPNGCSSGTTDDYWEVVSECCADAIGGCD